MAMKTGGWQGLEYYLIPSHAHLNLVGWVSMMIFGVAYHILPRFTGQPLYSRKMAWAHFILAQAGLIGMAGFLFLNRWQTGEWATGLIISATLLYFSICLFIWNILKTILARREV